MSSIATILTSLTVALLPFPFERWYHVGSPLKNSTQSNTSTAGGLAPWAQWAAATLFWGFITVLSNLQIWLIARPPGEQSQVRQVLTLQSVFYLAWIPFTVPLWRLVARWDPGALGAWRWIALHLGGAAAVAFLHTFVVSIVVEAMVDLPGATLGRVLVTQFRGRVYLLVIIYAGIVASGLAFTLYDRWRDRAAVAARLEGQLADARLSALRAQLHPHFLFNSLHAIASLVRESRNAAAVRLSSGMSDLLRRGLDTSATLHAVDDEVALVRTYLEIQQARFGDRLHATVNTSPGVGTVRVPVLLIQPLVENALRHGLGGNRRGRGG